MDALALLCTLHADGPSTLHALRSAGCKSLLDLQECSSTELAQFLELSVASAERFQREAELLGMRLTPLEPEAPTESRAKLSLTEVETAPEETAEETPLKLPEESLAEEVQPEEEPEEEPEAPRVITPLPPALAGSRANRSWFSATRIPQASAQAQGVFGQTATTSASQVQVEPAPPTPVLEFEELSEAAPLDAATCQNLKAAQIAVEVLAGEVLPAEGLPAEVPATEPVLESEPAALESVALEDCTPAATYVTEPEPELAQIAPEFPELAEAILRLGEASQGRAYLPTPAPEAEIEFEPATIETAELEQAEVQITEASTPLELGQPDGIDSELLDALQAAGITTAEALVEASGLELSRELSIPFTRLLELQLGAQHLFRRPSTLVPQKSKRQRAGDRLSEQPSRAAKMRRHTDSHSTQPTPTHRDADSLAQEVKESELSDAFDSPSGGTVGGPFA